jgi:hypothetical protein
VLVKNKKGKMEERAPEVNFDEKILVGKNLQAISVRLISSLIGRDHPPTVRALAEVRLRFSF